MSIASLETRQVVGNTLGRVCSSLTEEEWQALQIVVLRTEAKKETYGGSHQLNWKRTCLSTAYFKKEVVRAERMPTPRAAVAVRYSTKPYQKETLKEKKSFINNLYSSAEMPTSYECSIWKLRSLVLYMCIKPEN